MRARADSIVVNISRAEGERLRTQILELCGGSMRFYEKDTIDSPIHHLFILLSGQFENSTESVNFVRGQILIQE